METTKARLGTLKSVFPTAKEWGTDIRRQKIVDGILANPIAPHAIVAIKEQGPLYCFPSIPLDTITETDEPALKKGRGKAASTAKSLKRLETAREAPLDASTTSSSAVPTPASKKEEPQSPFEINSCEETAHNTRPKINEC